VPEVQTSATGSLCAWAIPNAIYAADRSSGTMNFSMAMLRANEIVIKALRDPGQITAFFIPLRRHISDISKIDCISMERVNNGAKLRIFLKNVLLSCLISIRFGFKRLIWGIISLINICSIA